MIDIRYMTARVHVAVQTVNKCEWEWNSSPTLLLHSSESEDAYHVMIVRGGVRAEHSFPKRNVVHFEAQSTI